MVSEETQTQQSTLGKKKKRQRTSSVMVSVPTSED